MATFSKRGDKWRAQVRIGGVARSKTFSAKAAAKAWASKTEGEIEDGVTGKIPNKTFGDLLARYRDEVTPKKRGRVRETTAVNRLIEKDKDLASVKLRDLSSKHIAGWRDKRLTEVSGSSVDREMNILSHACSVARREWKWLTASPTVDVSRPQRNKARKRRPSNEEIERLRFVMGYEDNMPPTFKYTRVCAMFLFAIETGIRSGEIAKITKACIHERYVHLPAEITKNGHERDVPLSIEARRILDQVLNIAEEGESSPVFGVTPASVDVFFRKYRNRAAVEGLQFRDSRHEALTRLSKKYNPMELAKISGHRDLKILLNVYYNPTADELAKKID